jgi:hypothetical protein
MIAFFDLNLKQIAKDGRNYPWPRPSDCVRCGHPKVWGHGFVRMIIEGVAKALEMRRYRCPKCVCVIRLRPTEYFPRHQTDKATIRRTLAHRLEYNRWPTGCITSRARHWLRALKRNAMAVLGMPGRLNLMAAFDLLLEMGRVPVRRAV